ncbi:MAG: aldo/keto reductase [Gammaproteobacteria bacterium]|nr:aldo/keto reductase [Gammaproteobacteria bacterium]MDH5659723.1 aldo/keto reductase [Gammaproteobacteria bacterium]
MAALIKRQLGSTGIEISVLGLGTVKLGRDQEVKYPSGFTIPNDNEVRDLLALAQDLGINFIDTAPAYGNSEERLGQLMPNPNDWVIMTKVGEIFENGQSRFDFSAVHTRMSVERSLKRLKRDSLDMVLVHSNGDDMHIINNEGALEELDRLKQKGLIKSFGMSTKTVEGGMWIVENTDVVMATLNLSDDHDLPVIARAHELNKGVVVKKGLQSGHADKSAGGGGVEKAFKYIFDHAGVSSVIVGTINPKHLKQNIEMVNKICG